MDLELTPEQTQLEQAVGSIMKRFRGLERTREVGQSVDQGLLATLDDNGYLDVVRDAGAPEGVLVVEQAADGAALAPIAARVLIGPLAGVTDLPRVVGLVDKPSGTMVRYAADCEAFLVIDGDALKLAGKDDVDVEPIDTTLGAQYGKVVVRKGETIGSSSADRLRRAWEVGIAVEAGAAMLAAVALTVDHVTQRHQFGKPIGSFQAVQHRLARAFGMATGTKWLARRAAAFPNDDFLTASAATYACEAAETAYTNTHQVSGAIGITSEYGLSMWTLRLVGLRSELGGKRAHARRVAAARRQMDLSHLPQPVHPLAASSH